MADICAVYQSFACCICRSKQNAVSKYFDADWVQRAARQGAAQAAAAGGRPVVVDLRCCWNQTNTATGRLSSCSPNLQVGCTAMLRRADAFAQGISRLGCRYVCVTVMLHSRMGCPYMLGWQVSGSCD